MHSSFQYEVLKMHDGVQVRIFQHRWKVFLVSGLWTSVWVAAALSACHFHLGNTYAGFLGMLLSFLFAAVGTVIAVRSVLHHALTLLPAGLRVRPTFLGIGRTRSWPLSAISHFGFGRAGHSLTPVLRLELRDESNPKRKPRWIVLATGTTEQEVDLFLKATENQGFQLPN
jgi:hypothetical protein